MKWEEMTCPECGSPVYATLETLCGAAPLTEDGNGGYEYQGETKIFWDEQHTAQVNGKDCLLCENHHEWASARIEE